MTARSVCRERLFRLVKLWRIECAVAHSPRRIIHESRNHTRVDEIDIIGDDFLLTALISALFKAIDTFIVKNIRIGALKTGRLMDAVIQDNELALCSV